MEMENGNGKLAGNARLLSILFMALDVENYAKVKQKMIFIDDDAIWIGDKCKMVK